MFKKVITILFIPLFLLTTGGVILNSHFCKMRGSSDISFGINPEKSCCGNKAMQSGCCKNEVKVIKITDDYSPSVKLKTEKENLFTIIIFPSVIAEVIPRILFRVPNYHSPPPHSHVRLHILYRSILV